MISLLKISNTKIIKSSSLWISIVFILFFLAFAPNAFGNVALDSGVPNAEQNSALLSTQVVGAIVITGLLLTVITTLGESFVKIKSSLIYKNMKLNNKPKYQFYISTVLPVILFSTLVFSFSMIIVAIFDSIGLLGYTSNIIDWNNIQYGYLLLSIITTITLCISISLLISSVSKTINIYTALTWAYLFLIFFFGGSSVPIFLIRGEGSLEVFMYLSFFIPNTFSNFLFINSMAGKVDFAVTDTLQKVTMYLDVIAPIVLSALFIGIRYPLVKKFG